MADYFTHFSCVLDAGTPEKAVQALDLHVRLCAEDEGSDDPNYSGFALSLQDGPGTSVLWFHDDGQGDVEAVISFVLRLAAEIDLTGLWGFDYALCRIRHKAYYAGSGLCRMALQSNASIDLPFDPTDQRFQRSGRPVSRS